ncbi:MAG: thioesterase family protein [Alphaproteobacteria bacterium]|nr:thioesterase family protein [Alphaproteobacteria bacterium]
MVESSPNGPVEIYRGLANAWECDLMGHLNVQFYTDKLVQGLAHLAAAVGAGRTYEGETGRTVRLARSLNRHSGELKAGDALLIRATVDSVGETSAAVVAEFVDAECRTPVAVFDLEIAHLAADSVAPEPWPAMVRKRLAAAVRPRSDAPRPPGTGAPSTAPASGFASPFVSGRGTVQPWQLDAAGRLAPRFQLDAVISAIGHIRHRVGLDAEMMAARNWGMAGLEYRVAYLAPCGPGEIYTLRSGLAEVGRKTFRFCHRLANDSTGEAIATVDMVSCLFDLVGRRAVTIPDEIASQAGRLIVPWPPDLEFAAGAWTAPPTVG